VFNLSGSEIVVIVLLALIVLGPEKLPEAIRRFGRVYGELKRMSTGFQSEFRNAFDEPIREFRETAQLTKDAVMRPMNEVRDTIKEAGKDLEKDVERSFREASSADAAAEDVVEEVAGDGVGGAVDGADDDGAKPT
jgi:sec-independent protein translocase protein TatB